MRAPAILAALVLLGVGVATLGALGPWLFANGITWGTSALAAFAFSAVGAAVAFASRRMRKGAAVLALIALGFDAAWALMRWGRPLPPEQYDVCFSSACIQPRISLGRLVPELESIRAGLWITRLAGITRPDEYASYSSIVRAGPDGLPNPAFEVSLPGRVTLYRYRGSPKPSRCIVFLHGFGGLLTAYLEVLARSDLGKDALVLAPVLDPVGQWASARGAEVVDEVLKNSGFDRCWFIGLSNGAVAAWELPWNARIKDRVAGAVLLSGLGEGDPAVPTLVISGTHDARFPWPWIESQVSSRQKQLGPERLALRGLDADHFLILSAHTAWTAAALDFVTKTEAR